ncbi:MAG: tRNA (adenosine(37)-N6)-threonylcarbamoyltransferase complex transferase subunit TsaD [Parcubacteria group bacterium]|nr:tRNA (adenosine(37)-N6)-threonylcarbamoyltransferase complex transferase subunit TsaD [Parcubacteria group bacterium]
MIILGIETSCDETGIALVRGGKHKLRILSNVVASQIAVHRKWGGVVPSLAKREHQKNLVPVLKAALRQAGLYRKAAHQKQPADLKKKLASILAREPALLSLLFRFLVSCKVPAIDAIAVTNRPGLEPALWTGINFAKALALAWEKPLLGIDHLKGHLLVANPFPKTPALSLVVSGGHTALILSKRQGSYVIIGETRDDAAGEVLDKCARLLGLGYPGGPIVARKAALAGTEDVKRFGIKLPRPMMHSHDYNFSFSGLKTAVLYDYRSRKASVRRGKAYIRAMCFELQQSVIDVLCAKTLGAAQEYEVKSMLLGGGVSANTELRKQIAERVKARLPAVSLYMPTPEFCTDNGVMAAVAGYVHYQGINLTRLRKSASWRTSRRIVASSHTSIPR